MGKSRRLDEPQVAHSLCAKSNTDFRQTRRPVGFCMAMAQPKRLKVVAAQNMAAYSEALGPT
jgi:hypothetical protein